MPSRTTIIICAIILASSRVLLAQSDSLRIATIRVDNLDVFAPEEARRGWLYRAANVLHIQTRESVIRRMLLFEEGDRFSLMNLAESERKLRELPFLKSAAIVPGEPHNGLIDITVTTQDSWTTEPGISFGYKGGRSTFGFDLKEKNVLGSGGAFSIGYKELIDRTASSIQYVDPRLFGPYWRGVFAYSKNSDGSQQRFVIGRPFYSTATPWSTEVTGDNIRQNVKLYRNAEMSAEFRQDHTAFSVTAGIALRANDRHAQRLSVGFETLSDLFRALPTDGDSQLPADRDYRFMTVGFEDVESDYVKFNHVNRDSRFEDFNLARHLNLTFGISPQVFDRPRSTLKFDSRLREGLRLLRGAFLLGSVEFQSRWDQRPQNEILAASVGLVLQSSYPLRQTTVAEIRYNHGWHLDRDVQFYADGMSGLRGYHLYAFDGDWTFMGNFEHRIYLGKELLQLVSPGFAVFFDFGSAGSSGAPILLDDLKTDVGIGLRLGIPRAAAHNVIRFDVAYAFQEDPLGRNGWLISFGEGQAF